MSEKRTTVYLLDVVANESGVVKQKLEQFREKYAIPYVAGFRSMNRNNLFCFIIQIEGEHADFERWCDAAVITDRLYSCRKIEANSIETYGIVQNNSVSEEE